MPATITFSGITIRLAIDPTRMSTPPKGREIASAVRGGQFNLEYVDLSKITWSETDEAIEQEKEILKGSMTKAGDKDQLIEFLRVADEEFYRDDFEGSSAFDLGARSALLALNAAGCPTFASCGGHDYLTGSDNPYVAFFADQRHAEIVMEVAGAVGVGLCPTDLGGIEVFSDRLDGLFDFAVELRRRAEDFDRLRR